MQTHIGALSAVLDSDCEHSSPVRQRGVEMRENRKRLSVEVGSLELVASATQDDKYLRRYGLETELDN